MESRKSASIHLSPAFWTGIGSLTLSALFLGVHWHLSVLTLALFLLLCFVAPFMHRLGFFMPVISRGRTGRKSVALTFDDGPDPLVTPALLGLLASRGKTATFFVSGSMAACNPHLVEQIISQGHTVGNHAYSHDPLVYFKGVESVRHEVASTQELLRSLGVNPLVYRPPLGIVGPGLRKPLNEFGLSVVNFSCRALDRGNKNIDGLAERILKRVKADDIILLHDIMPKGKTYVQSWMSEMEALLNGLDSRGLSVLPLETLIGMPVMTLVNPQMEQYQIEK